MAYVHSEGNRIVVEGEFGLFETQLVIAAMHNLTTQKGYKDFSLDFTECTFAGPTSMLPIAARAQHYWKRGIDIELKIPKAMPLQGVFVNANWAYWIDVQKYRESEFKGWSQIPGIHFQTGAEQYKAVTRIIELMIVAGSVSREDLRAIEWALNEVTDNVLNHAASEVGGFVQVTNFPKKRCIEFAVADAGMGIPTSLRSGQLKGASDTEALDKAIREGVTRDISVGQGNGLFGTWRVCEISKGNFFIYSGNALLEYRPKKTELAIKRVNVPFNGTLVAGSINYGTGLDPSEALVFKGHRSVPVDHIDVKYHDDGSGNLEFNLSTESDGFGSRSAGDPIRRKLLGILAMSGDSVITVRCEDVPLVSSSYADEVFGKLFWEMGPLAFAQRIRLDKPNKFVRQLIDKAITQRGQQLQK